MLSIRSNLIQAISDFLGDWETLAGLPAGFLRQVSLDLPHLRHESESDPIPLPAVLIQFHKSPVEPAGGIGLQVNLEFTVYVVMEYDFDYSSDSLDMDAAATQLDQADSLLTSLHGRDLPGFQVITMHELGEHELIQGRVWYSATYQTATYTP